MTQVTVQEIEQSIQAERQHIELDKALERLESNRDFNTVITEGYLAKEAIRLVHLKADPQMQRPEKQVSIAAQIDAIGHLAQYFRTVGQLARMAVKSIETSEAVREEMLAEENERG